MKNKKIDNIIKDLSEFITINTDVMNKKYGAIQSPYKHIILSSIPTKITDVEAQVIKPTTIMIVKNNIEELKFRILGEYIKGMKMLDDSICLDKKFNYKYYILYIFDLKFDKNEIYISYALTYRFPMKSLKRIVND